MCTDASPAGSAETTTGERAVLASARGFRHGDAFANIYRTKKIPCSCGAWRNLLPSVFAALEAGGDALDATHPHGHVYEFGLFNGASMRLLRRMRPFANAPTFGFDSFQGLPPVQAGNGSMEKVLWKQGQFRADPRAKLQAELGRSAPLTFVPGFYSESLSRPGLSEQLGMQVAKYVDIDVDLYSSTVQLLDFMFSSRLIKPGTVFGYDDFWSSACQRHAAADEHPLQHGEGLAHAEAARKYGASLRARAVGMRRSAARSAPSFWSPKWATREVRPPTASACPTRTCTCTSRARRCAASS